MMPLCWSVLLLFLSANAENIAVYRQVGESVTLKCSSEGCPSSVEESIGVYLYRQVCKGEEEVLYYHRRNDKISPRHRFISRIETTGSLMNHIITISSLTMEDTGFYRCVYVKKDNDRVECNGYILVVREDIAVYRQVGESVTLKCSSEGCPSSVEKSIGMYLYQQEYNGVEEVLYYDGWSDKISPQKRFINRIETTGSLMNHTITISSLTMEDAGFHHCVYVNKDDDTVKCKGYTLIVRGMPCVPPNQSPSLELVIISTCVLSTLVTVIFILLILRAKQRASSRRTTRRVNDNVYEVMTRNALCPLAAPEQSSLSPYVFA